MILAGSFESFIKRSIDDKQGIRNKELGKKEEIRNFKVGWGFTACFILPIKI